MDFAGAFDSCDDSYIRLPKVCGDIPTGTGLHFPSPNREEVAQFIC